MDFEILEEATPVQVPGWDSLGWMRILSSVEAEFDVELDFEAVESVYSIGQLVDLLDVSLREDTRT